MEDFNYKALFENIGVAICICDRTGNILTYNHLFDNLFGKHKIKNINEIPEKGYKDPIIKVIQLADEGYAGVPYPFTFWASLGDNRRKYEVNISRQPATDFFIITIADITKRAEAYEELNRRNRELSCLVKIHQLTSSSFNLEDIAKTTVTESCKIFDFPVGFILLPDNTKLLRIISYYSTVPIDRSFINEIENILNSGRIITWAKDKFKTILIGERAINEVTEKEAELLKIFNVSSLVAVPIVVKGEIFGFVIFGRKESYNLFFDQVSILETLAHQIGISIQNAMLFRASEKIKERVIKQNETLNLIYKIGLMYFQNLRFDELMKEASDDIFRITGFDGLTIVYQRNNKPGVYHYLRDKSFLKNCHGDLSEATILELSKPMLTSKNFLFIEDISESDEIPLPIKENMAHCDIRSLFITAIREKESKIGFISCFSIGKKLTYSSEDLSLWTSLTVFIESLINNYDFRNELTIREQELSRLSKKLISAQEDEKKRIAKEIHDSLGQLIYTLNLNISMLSQDDRLSKNPILNKAQEIINQIQEDIRKISYELRPPTLEEMGLISALRWLIDQLKNPNIKISLGTNLPSGIKFPYPVQVQIFRIAQEALTNILKHSNATEANLFLYENERSFFMEINDNGIGIPSDEELKKGIGIIGMKERAISIGGTLKITSSKETGTTILLEINKC
ncbi:MAG: GAF domain-containing protein [Deltaproteobacteria bacterium]|nr:GAF domain-containing protein [Deltaproteobacteria bacterium]